MLKKTLASAVCIFGLLLSNIGETQTPAPSEGGAAAAAPAEGTAPEGENTTAETTAAPSHLAVSPGSYMVQLKGLEQKVNELKERIFRSKARLNLLKETVLHGVIAGSRAKIKHQNDMGSSFKLIKLVYAVDGAQIYSKTDDSGVLDDQRKFEIFNGSIVPGNHTISVMMIFRGHGYGIFSYLKGYKFTVRSSHTFTAGEGRETEVTVRAFEKGNVTTDLKDRPAVKFEVNLFSAGGRGKGAAK